MPRLTANVELIPNQWQYRVLEYFNKFQASETAICSTNSLRNEYRTVVRGFRPNEPNRDRIVAQRQLGSRSRRLIIIRSPNTERLRLLRNSSHRNYTGSMEHAKYPFPERSCRGDRKDYTFRICLLDLANSVCKAYSQVGYETAKINTRNDRIRILRGEIEG